MPPKMNKKDIYQSLVIGYEKAHPCKSKKEAQGNVVVIWNKLKSENRTDDKLVEACQFQLMKWKQLENKQTMAKMAMWGKLPCKLPSVALEEAGKTQIDDAEDRRQVDEEKKLDREKEIDKSNENTVSSRSYATPKQDTLKEEISVLKSECAGLGNKKDMGLATPEDCVKLKKLYKQIDIKERELADKVRRAKNQAKFRDSFKRKLDELDDESKKRLKPSGSKSQGGRPPNCDIESLHAAILDIALKGSAADDRRRNEMIRSIHSLDDLTAALNKLGFNLKRSAVYYHLLPRNSRTAEGKRHYKTVPVKLIRCGNTKHADHPDSWFARSTIKNMEELAGLLGPNEVTFHSQDDKARVPIGLTAANKQSPIVMHMDYQVKLSDHDFVIASKHKLIPSVIASIAVKPNTFSGEAVTYSGPTYVGIRSGKHSTSTAEQHLKDMKTLIDIPEFKSDMFAEDGFLKPVFMVTVDGGPDENPRYAKTIDCAIDYFKHCNLDTMMVATNAPGRSAYNRVERRMAPLSRDLAGVVLPHDHFGSHLNSSGETVDVDLEIKNFKHAGQILAQIWSETEIDGFSTVAKYVDEDGTNEVEKEDAEWKKEHVMESQYFLQITKCLKNRDCCSPFRSSYLKLVPGRFLPPPLSLQQTENGIAFIPPGKDDQKARFPSLCQIIALGDGVVPDRIKNAYPKGIPYDLACPTIQDMLPRRICQICGLYFASIKSENSHRKICKAMKKKNLVPASSKASQPDADTDRKVRPVRMAAKRQRELMCTIKMGGYEVLEWLDQEDLDVCEKEFQCVPLIAKKSGTPVLPERAQPWTDDC